MMCTIKYLARTFRPRDHDPDAAGPIATPVTSKDFAFVLAQDDQGRYIYDRLVEIRVTTARPVEFKMLVGQAKSIRRWTIEVKTRDKSVASSHLVMAWFPYSFDWDDSASFKGHRNRSKAQTAALLDQVARGDIPCEEFLRSNQYRDVFETSSNMLTAYFPDPRRADESSWSRRRSPLLKPSRHGGLEATELLTFGICPDLNTTVEAVLTEAAMLKLFSAVDDWVFYRLWKDHPFCPPRRLRPELLANETLDKILRSSIRKAIAGPARNQESFLGWPVSSWARAVFLGSLYNLNRRKELPEAFDEPTSAADEQVPQQIETAAETDFLGSVADLVQHLDEASLDMGPLLDGAERKLTSSDAEKRVSALALVTALRDFVRIGPEILRQVRELARDDFDSRVREAAVIALRLLEKDRIRQD